jgi:hypothetical protein
LKILYQNFEYQKKSLSLEDEHFEENDLQIYISTKNQKPDS